MSEPSERAVQANIVYAISLLNEGTPPEAVQAELVERGLTEEIAASVVRNLLMQAIHTDAVDMLNKGLSAERVKRHLVAKGVQQQTAAGVVEDILEQKRRPPPLQGHPQEQEPAEGILLKLLGGVIFVVGLGLFFGSIVRALPMLHPFVGGVVMGIGIFIWRIS